MRITLLAVGRMKAGPERDLCNRYLSRLSGLGPKVGFAEVAVREAPESRAGSEEERRRAESRALCDRLAPGGRLAALDARGLSLSSEEFARLLSRIRDEGTQTLALAIGGADGLDAGLREKADWTLCFGALTWPHQLARIMALEQIYRAATLLAGHPYHRGG